MIHNEWEEVYTSHKTKLGMHFNDEESVCGEDAVSNDKSKISTFTARIKGLMC
jgi:hypothetical protein